MKQQEMLSAPPGSIEVELPWPPSANHYKNQTVMLPKIVEMKQAFNGNWNEMWKFIRSKTRAVTFLSEEAKEYHAKVYAIVVNANARKFFVRDLRMTIHVFPPDLRKRDQSNLLKMIEDALVQSKVMEDDSQIKEHHVYFGEVVKFGKVVVKIEELL